MPGDELMVVGMVVGLVVSLGINTVVAAGQMAAGGVIRY